MLSSADIGSVERSLRRLAVGIAAFVVVSGAAAIAAWLSGAGVRFAFGFGQVPVAPGTALLCLLLGAAVLTGSATAPGRPTSALSLALSTATLALSLTIAVSRGLEFDLGLERWLSGTSEIRGGIRIGRVSFITASLFAALASALLLNVRAALRPVSSVIVTLVLAASVVILQGYALGAPLLYGSGFIPVAAPTAVLLGLSAVSALLHLGPERWPIRLLLPDARIGVPPTKGAFVWLALVLSGVIATSGYYWYRGETRRNEERTSTSLSTVVQLKARELDSWHRGHLTTAVAVSKRVQPAAAILAQARPGSASTNIAAVSDWLSTLLTDGEFARVELFDGARRSVVFAGDDDPELASDLARQLALLPSTDTVVVHDLYLLSGRPWMVFWSPLPRLPGRDARPGAWVALAVDAEKSLFPLLRHMPLPYRTGEFVLWRVDGDSIRIASAGGASEQQPASRTRSIRDPNSPVARGVRDGGGSFASIDYRGVPVRGTTLAVPRTSWMLVAKIDEAEIREPVRSAALRATVLSLLVLLGAAAIIYALWYRRDLARSERERALLADRERGVAELRLNEARYARALRGTADGLWDWDFSTDEVFVSPRWRDIVGVPSEDEVHSPHALLSYFEPADVVRHEHVLARHLEHGEPYDLEMQLRSTPQEPPRWIRTRGEVERDERGQPLRMGGAITDITRRRLAEASLRRSERVLRMRSAVNQALVRAEIEEELFQVICEVAVREGGYRMAWIGLKEHDEERSVTPVAIAGEEHGYLRENPVGWGETERGQSPTGHCLRTGVVQVAQDLLAEQHYTPWREAARARGYQSSISIPLFVRNEVIGAFTLYAVEPSAFDAEEMTLATELGRDISFGVAVLRDHRTLAAQREQLTLFRQAIDRSADAIYVADAATGHFIDFNLAALAQLGYTDAEMRAIGPADVVPDIAARGGLSAVSAAVRDAGGLVRTSLHRRKDGSDVPVEIALSVLSVGQRTLLLGIARDISERVKAQGEREELQFRLTHAQRMESIGRLAGGVAHDFNNLLTVITTSADLAIGELPADHAILRDIKEIRSAGERAARLTRQLLAFSRQQVLKREVLNLNEVVTRFLAMLSRVIGEDVRLELRLAPSISATFADAGQLEQVLMNLCVNARDAMPRGGTLTIATAETRVDEDQAARRDGMTHGAYVTLAVTDSGLGMDKATQSKIFEPFFTTKEQGRGTGLGLATVYGIVKQSGGSVWCYSEPGLGTTFRIYLPVTDEVVTEQTSAPTRHLAAGKETVLVVEDEESIRFAARRVLERSGYTVLEADSGAAALALLANHSAPLDLVLSDLVMPGMTGIELAEELKKTRPTLKMLFTSGYSAEVVSDRFRPDGEWNFISKPYGVRDLVNEVRRVLDS